MAALFSGRLEATSESTLLRFIRGYKDDAKPEEKAIEMLGKMLNWRDEVKINEIINTQYPKEQLFKSIWTSGLHGQHYAPIISPCIYNIATSKIF
jgi:hypothetical protein